MRDLIDTHAHLAHKRLVDNIDDILLDAGKAGIGDVISIGCSVAEADKSIELSYIYPNVYSTAGLYPHGEKDHEELSLEEQLEKIAYLANEPKVVAVGECGFDFKTPGPGDTNRSKEDQESLFRKQIDIARNLDKPIVIHSREALRDTIRVLTEEYESKPFRAVWHCYTENLETAEKLIGMGMMISITGLITYPNSEALRKVVKSIPLESIMLETDAPYLTPQKDKDRGKNTNKPEYLINTAQEIANIKGCSIDEIAEKTSQNALDFFKF